MKTFMNDVKFDERGLISGIIQDSKNGQVLMFAFLNREALLKTLKTGIMHFFSRSRQRIWLKGEESGHIQRVKGVYLDCDGDCLLFSVDQAKAACHAGYRTCFYRKASMSEKRWRIVFKRVFEPKKIYKKSVAEPTKGVPNPLVHRRTFKKRR